MVVTVVVIGTLLACRCWLSGAMVERVVGGGRVGAPVVNTAAAAAAAVTL